MKRVGERAFRILYVGRFARTTVTDNPSLPLSRAYRINETAY